MCASTSRGALARWNASWRRRAARPPPAAVARGHRPRAPRPCPAGPVPGHRLARQAQRLRSQALAPALHEFIDGLPGRTTPGIQRGLTIASGPSFRLDRHPDPATMSVEWACVDDSTERPSEWHTCARRGGKLATVRTPGPVRRREHRDDRRRNRAELPPAPPGPGHTR